MEEYSSAEQREFLETINQFATLRNKGTEIIRKFWEVLRESPYKLHLGSPSHYFLFFDMFGQEFQVYAEVSFENSGRLTDGILTTYFRESALFYSDPKLIKLHSINFDRIGNIDNLYTLDDFSTPYLMKIVSEYKKFVAEKYSKENYSTFLK